MEWIAEADKVEKFLISLGVPDATRMSVMSQVSTLLARAENEAVRAKRDARAVELLGRGRMEAAEVLGVAPSTVYKMVHRSRKFSTVSR